MAQVLSDFSHWNLNILIIGKEVKNTGMAPGYTLRVCKYKKARDLRVLIKNVLKIERHVHF